MLDIARDIDRGHATPPQLALEPVAAAEVSAKALGMSGTEPTWKPRRICASAAGPASSAAMLPVHDKSAR
jgi:hypothetical protein